jgi:hypothetical protein
VASYPPLVHQALALLAQVVGLEIAYGLVLFVVLTGLSPGIYAFARIFVEPRPASYAALLGATLPGIYLAAHAFGQLPTVTGLLAALVFCVALDWYLIRGRATTAALAVSLAGVVGAAHHGTLLLLPVAALAVSSHAVATGRVELARWLQRMAVVVPCSAVMAVLVVWPFWQWGAGQTMQVPIDHLSRHNLLRDFSAQALFFWGMYGPFALLVPLLPRLVRRRAHLIPALLFAFLFVMGLGGTTELPRWLLGTRWAWLTYDRFSLWAGVTGLIFAGLGASRLECAMGRSGPLGWRTLAAAVVIPMAVVSGQASIWAAGQPPRLDMDPVVDFLNRGHRAEWRYLTFGFGDQLARLSVLTEATTIDGSYHTARQLPELRKSGLGKIDTAFWSDHGLDGLHPVLERAGERGVRWGFVHRPEYGPVLVQHGWLFLRTLENGVDVWLNPEASRPPQPSTEREPSRIAAVSWGLLPLIVLAASAGLGVAEWRLGGGGCWKQ